MEKSHQETNKGRCSNPTAAWTAQICSNTEDLFINLRGWLNRGCQEYGKLSLLCGSEQLSALPSADTQCTAWTSTGMRPACCSSSCPPAPAFINCFHRQRVSLLGDQSAPPGGSCCLWPAQSSLYKAWRVQCEECAVSHGLLNLQRGSSWQRSIVVLWKEQNGTRASSPANCFINLESNNGLLNKALLFYFAIVLFWLPRKAPALRASQGFYKYCLWF